MNIKRGYVAIAEDVVKAQRGDRAAMDRIIADVQDPVYYTCLSILRSEDAAQDAAQDVLLSVFTKIGSLKDAGAYIGWVNRITANTCKLRLMKPNREVFLAEDKDGKDPFAAFEDVDEQTIPDKALDNAETQRMVVELVNNLPDEQRMCVMLYYYDDMRTREIADALDVPEGTVKSRLNYARKSLKEGVERLEKQGDIRLHGLSPIPFLAYWLKKAAEENASPVTAQIVRAAAGHAAAAAGTTAASGASAAASAATASTTASAAAGTGTFAAIAGKVVSVVLSIGILAGIGYGIWSSIHSEPPVIPEDAFMTPEPDGSSAAPEETPQPTADPGSETPEPTDETGSGTHLYGSAYFRGAKFTVDQDYHENEAIRVTYENDDTVFTLDTAEYALETETGTYITRETHSGKQIEAGESGVFEPVWADASGTPIALTVRGIVPQSEDPDSASFRIVFANAPADETVQARRITGAASAPGASFSVDQIYADDGKGKIILVVYTGGYKVETGVGWVTQKYGFRIDGTARLTTEEGEYETAVIKAFEYSVSGQDAILYFDNAEGVPSELTINGITVLDDNGDPIGESESVTIRFTAEYQAVGVWTEFSTTAPPAGATHIQERVRYQAHYSYYEWFVESAKTYPEKTNAFKDEFYRTYGRYYSEDQISITGGLTEESANDVFGTYEAAEAFINEYKSDPAYRFDADSHPSAECYIPFTYNGETSQRYCYSIEEMNAFISAHRDDPAYVINYDGIIVRYYVYYKQVFYRHAFSCNKTADWVDEKDFAEPQPRFDGEDVSYERQTEWSYIYEP